MRKILIVTILVSSAATATPKRQQSAVDLAADSLTFCMSGNCGSLPDTSVFSDPTNNSIGNACIHNVRVSQLMNIDEIEDHLNSLAKANVIALRNGRCSLTFPVIEGSRRERITRISKDAAIKLRPTALALIRRLQSAVPERRELMFHLLWSRVIDDGVVWQRAWREAFGPSPLPDVAWAVFPTHSFTVGTYSYPLNKSDWLAFTTTSNSYEYKSTIVDLAAELERLALGGETGSPSELRLQQLGFLDSRRSFRVFTYRTGDPFDQLVQQLTSEYATALTGVYDYRSLAKSFGVSPQHMFCILLHETAYALLDNLKRSGDLSVPAILTSKDVVQLVSIRTADAP